MKKALGINAAFSGLSGIVLILFQNLIAGMFELNTATPFWIVGSALLFFSVTIVYEMKTQNRVRIIWIITQDMLWVAGSIYLLVANPFAISRNGSYAIAVVAIIVLLMAINQTKALNRQTK
jgi:hypothetical protein